MSKRELFKEICNRPHIVTHGEAAMELASEWAQIEAISFAEWIEDNACCRDGVWYIFGDYKENRWGEVDEDCKKYTTAQLYQLYKETQQTKGDATTR